MGQPEKLNLHLATDLELVVHNEEDCRNVRYVIATESDAIIVYETLDDELQVYTLSITELNLVMSLVTASKLLSA